MDGLRNLTLLLVCLTLQAAVLQAARRQGAQNRFRQNRYNGKMKPERINEINEQDIHDLGSEEKELWGELENGSEEVSTEDKGVQDSTENEEVKSEESELVKLSLASRALTAMKKGFQSMLHLVKEHDKRLDQLDEYADNLMAKVDDLIDVVGVEEEKVKQENDCSTADKSGTYTISNGLKMKAYCEVDDTGKWTVIQKREDGSVDFNKNWAEYSEGFGDVDGEYWLGNDNIHKLTAAGLTKLRVDLEDWENNKHTVYYDDFQVAGAEEKYKLSVSGFQGPNPPGNGLHYHDGMQFSTPDQDNDVKNTNCASSKKGGWWFKSCQRANLNGQYKNTKYAKGINWYSWKGFHYSLKKVTMMIRKP